MRAPLACLALLALAAGAASDRVYVSRGDSYSGVTASSVVEFSLMDGSMATDRVALLHRAGAAQCNTANAIQNAWSACNGLTTGTCGFVITYSGNRDHTTYNANSYNGCPASGGWSVSGSAAFGDRVLTRSGEFTFTPGSYLTYYEPWVPGSLGDNGGNHFVDVVFDRSTGARAGCDAGVWSDPTDDAVCIGVASTDPVYAGFVDSSQVLDSGSVAFAIDRFELLTSNTDARATFSSAGQAVIFDAGEGGGAAMTGLEFETLSSIDDEFEIAYSDDNSAFTPVGAYVAMDATTTHRASWSDVGAHRYWRLQFVRSYSGSFETRHYVWRAPVVAEAAPFAGIVADAQVTANAAAWTGSGTGIMSPGTHGDLHFDGLDPSAQTYFVRWDLLVAHQLVGIDFDLTAVSSRFAIEFSDDDSTWTQVGTIYGGTRSTERNSLPTGSGDHRYWRLRLTSSLATPWYFNFVLHVTEPLCPDAPPAAPLLEGGSISDGNLVATWQSARDRYTSRSWAFVGATVPATCGSNGVTGGAWQHEVSSSGCLDEHTMTVPLTQALKECGFSTEPQDGGDTWYYEAVAELTTQEPNGTVFGVDTTRTTTTAFRVRVAVPKSVDVSASAVAYGNVIQFALLSQQEVDTSTATAAFKWTLVTSVQYPYQLTAKAVTEETAHDFESLTITEAAPVCPATGACTQTFEISATETTSCELTDAEIKSVFTIGCRSQFSGACDTPEGVETDTATFTVSTDSFCARVVEVATVTPTLTTSTSQGGASAIDFVLQTTLFGRVTFAIEAGLSVTGTRLLSLDLVSEETVQPVTGAGVQDSAVVSAISFLETDQGGTAPHLDFQFQLNTESVKFAVGGGQASLTITAVVEVTYDGAGSQRFEVQAVSGPGSMSTAASSTVGVSTPAAPGSASTAGSTVLGVSTGTAMIAGVGLVAVVALAAGAAVAARKHRASAAASRAAKLRTMHTAGASSSDLQLAAAPGAAPQIALDVSADLGAVQDAYGVTHAE